MKVRMFPHPDELGSTSSGIARVVIEYFRHMPEYGIELVSPARDSYDLEVGHAAARPGADINHNHGLIWTSERPATDAEHSVNKDLAETARRARLITVPSDWVAQVFRRDMRLSPEIVPHGVDWDAWQHNERNLGYVLYGKNRQSDGLSAAPLLVLAKAFPNIRFVTTVAPPGADRFTNIKEIGILPPDKFKLFVQRAAILFAPDRETWGILPIEAAAAGVPTLTTHRGAVKELIGSSGLVYYDEAEMVEGLAWLRDNREWRSEEAREIARQYTWQATCARVAGLYQRLFYYEPPTVDVVITYYNNKETLERAICSVLSQNCLANIFVVDDGSREDSARQIISNVSYDQHHLNYIYHEQNQGVAVARNTGLYQSKAKYICFLDADDAIEPGYLVRCVEALEKDHTASTAYTGIRVLLQEGVIPDGTIGMPWDWTLPLKPGEFINKNPWPRPFNYDDHISYKNQVPTGCVFKRSDLLRVGGYRQRYAPRGAGEEDAEIHVRLGAMGKAALYLPPQENALFVHSHGAGTISSNPHHQETDWLAWHPWVRDTQHPFASLATPANNIAHPVRSYENPIVSVIIPVGPGHEQKVTDALDSLEAQTFREWEVIVVWDTHPGLDFSRRFDLAYPYVKNVNGYDDLGEPAGAGHARNLGVSHAVAPLVAFLDADDTLRPDYLARYVQAFMQTGQIPFAAFYGQVQSDNPEQDAWITGQGKVVDYNPRTKLAVFEGHYDEFDCKQALAGPSGELPYVWTGINVLVPKAWHDQIRGFDETLSTWEDCDYLLRLAWAGHCFHLIDEPLWVYNFSAGARREQRDDRPKIMARLIEKHRMIVGYKNSDCGCGPIPIEEFDMSSDAFLPAIVNDGNYGTHNIVGMSTHTQYGYLMQGEAIRGGIHKDDLRLRPWAFACGYCQGKFTVTPDDVFCGCGGGRVAAKVPQATQEEVQMVIKKASKLTLAEVSDELARHKVIEPSDDFIQPINQEPLPPVKGLEVAVTSETPIRYLGTDVADRGVVRDLKKAGVTKVGHLQDKSREELLAIKGIGEKTVDKLLERIKELTATA